MFGPVQDPGDLVGWLIVLTAASMIGMDAMFRFVESMFHD